MKPQQSTLCFLHATSCALCALGLAVTAGIVPHWWEAALFIAGACLWSWAAGSWYSAGRVWRGAERELARRREWIKREIGENR